MLNRGSRGMVNWVTGGRGQGRTRTRRPKDILLNFVVVDTHRNELVMECPQPQGLPTIYPRSITAYLSGLGLDKIPSVAQW